ncbi:hypothetical protein ACH5RR_000929 [Cinchona calisaya]|uniref:Uncharacterized protein n=1 Tax=Cinchona calisaya TaxID=153742 RepID=A0ABD3B241_9GENT
MNDAVNAIDKEIDGAEDNNIDGFEEMDSVPDSQNCIVPSFSKHVKDGNKVNGKKRKLGSDYENNGLIVVANALRKIIEKTEARLGMIAERIGYEQDLLAFRKKVYASLEPMNWLSLEDKLIDASSITSTDKNLDLFFSVSDEDKEKMLNMILGERI